jgi:hypothetical protein
MFTKTIYALTAVLLLSAPPASALEEGGASAFAIPRDRGTEARAAADQNHFVSATRAYASAGRNGIVRQQPRNVRPFTEEERLWFRTAQGYEDRF